MQAVFLVTVPFFALVLCGYLAAGQRMLPINAVPGLNAFVLYFALPCLLFRFGARTPLLELLNPSVLGVYLLVAVLLVPFTIAMTLSRSLRLKDAAFGALVAVFPNTGFMGVPLLVALLGPAAAGPMICVLLADMVFTSSLCLGLASLHGQYGRGPWMAARSALAGALRNPLAWAIAGGGAMGAVGYELRGPLDNVVRMLADAASPVALFTVGAMLHRKPRSIPSALPSRTHSGFALTAPSSALLPDSHPGSPSVWLGSDEGGGVPTSPEIVSHLPRLRPRPSPHASQIMTVALIKLLLHPLAVLLIAASARALGAPLNNLQITVLTLAAALPSASNVTLLAERQGADAGFIARIVLVTTVLGLGSFTLLAWAVGARP